ncbi:WYL domain-containing protein [Chromatium okenii]|uniref:helix-turn-helix transcriptional regulator n=1 Tax=Chromatium okenii TaxID=61644 RepID=UPI0019042674|nr:WYL domain-containing protein [Chromatium okenii]MBK1642592.1 WYL domain-containing protein [Chromatium okenii]
MKKSIHQNRYERQKRLEALLPASSTAPANCPDGAHLLKSLGNAYGTTSDGACRRALQRDLDALVKDERIEAVNPNGKPLRYRRVKDDLNDDALIWEDTLQKVGDLVNSLLIKAKGVLPQRPLDPLWQRLLTDADGPVLDATRLRIIPDTLRLQPVELYPAVLTSVITALAQRCVLKVNYENADGKRAEVQIHPQALIQRGPIPYLLALKNDETEPVRFYALHRMTRPELLTILSARVAKNFDLDQAIKQGVIDFGSGKQIELELRVRGYLATVLTVCPLAPNQRFINEPNGSEFEIRVWATVPASGQLLRWLLGAGDNLEVIAPPDLRRVVAAQAAKTAALYRR